MPFDSRAGYGIYWQVFGSGDRNALAIHPTMAHSGAWRNVAADLPLNLLAFDLPGHGRSDPWSGTDYLGAAARIAETFFDGPTDLIGHSFGATVALRLALERPDLCRSLTLIEPVFMAAARADSAPEMAAYDRDAAPFTAAMQADDQPMAARLFTETWGAGPPWDSLSEDRRAAMTGQVALIAATFSSIESDSGGLLNPGRIESLAVPVLFLRGETSPPVVTAIHRALMRRMAGAKEVVVPGAGHMLPLTHPGPVAEAIRDHLSLTEAK